VNAPLLAVRDLRVRFETRPDPLQAVRGVSFDVHRGETLGIVGESGCGKSVTAQALLRLVDPPGRIVAGSVRLDGRELLDLPDDQLRAVRGGAISMIFQDPMTSLNPVFTIGRQLADVQRAHGRRDEGQRALEMLGYLGIPDPGRCQRQYPHQLSGGMRQRVMIAMALVNEPRLLIADEPTTALDVTVQAQIVELLVRLNETLGMAVVFISHDLRVVTDLCDRVLVFYAGRVVESGTSAEVLGDPRHPYSRALVRSVPDPDQEQRQPLAVIAGSPPHLAPPPTGCAFAARCPARHEACAADPPLFATGEGRASACWLHATDGAAVAPAHLEVR
jgi:oligopeptide/dipeptide ABC transporter ATP-binding protein